MTIRVWKEDFTGIDGAPGWARTAPVKVEVQRDGWDWQFALAGLGQTVEAALANLRENVHEYYADEHAVLNVQQREVLAGIEQWARKNPGTATTLSPGTS